MEERFECEECGLRLSLNELMARLIEAELQNDVENQKVCPRCGKKLKIKDLN